MKRKFPLLKILSFGLGPLMACGVHGSCGGGDPEDATSLIFSSKEGTATLMGFDEFIPTTSSPKKYLTQTIRGDIYQGTFTTDDCTGVTATNLNGADVATVVGGIDLQLTWDIAYDSNTDIVTLVLTKQGGWENDAYHNYWVWGVEWNFSASGDGVGFNSLHGQFDTQTGDVGSGEGLHKMTATFHRTVYDYFRLSHNGRHAGNGSALAFAQSPINGSFGSLDDLTRDEWDSRIHYPESGGDGPTSTVDNKRFTGTGIFPLTSGGTEDSWDGFLYSPDAAQAYGALVAITEETSTQRIYTGTDHCEGSGPYTKATGVITVKLTDEDTEQDAMNRATVTAGTNQTAFRSSRGSGYSFGFSEVEYTATFDVPCPGDYDILLHYSVKPHGSSGPVSKWNQMVHRQHHGGGPLIVTGKLAVEARDMDYTLESATASAACSDHPPGSKSLRMGSVDLSFGLGRTTGGASAGQLQLKSGALTATTYTPAELVPATPSGSTVEIIRDGANTLRQIRAPQTLADIVTLDPSSYEVRFYAPDDVGPQDSITRIYAVSGSPYVTYKIENPDAGKTERLHITETRGRIVRMDEYANDVATGAWALIMGNALRKESEVSTSDNGDTVKTFTVKGSDDTVVSIQARTYRTFPWGEELVREIIDPTGVALATTYEFYDNLVTDGDNYGHLKLQTNADGSWSRHTWDASGRGLKTVRPFLNAASTAAENLCRVVENTYTTLEDIDGDSEPEDLTSTVETTLGQETGRSYRVKWSAAVPLDGADFARFSDIRCVSAGAAWDATDNLVTETLVYLTDPFIGRSRRMVNPDGTATLIDYALEVNGELTTTTKTGAPNSSLNDIIDGTMTVTVTSIAGQVTAEAVTDIASTLLLSAWTATEFDDVGRPTRLDYDDGTYVVRGFASSGLSSERDRSGLVTEYRYDDLGRQVELIRQGVTIRTGYDADGRIKSTQRMGTDTSEITLETNEYDLAGRLSAHRDVLNRLTTYTESYNSGTGETTRTTTHPDLGTVIQVLARDGSPLSTTGTASAPRHYEYGFESGGLFSKTVLVGPLGASTEWSKTYTDLAGRSYKTVFADSATAESFFNAAGQLVRQVDPDGVTILYAYNARGDQAVTAIDLDDDDTIDYDGTDRVTRTTNDVTEHSGIVVRRSTTEVWETDYSDTPVTGSISEQSDNGMVSWQTIRGLTTGTVVTYDGSGGRTVTTTTPDHAQIVRVYVDDLLSSTTYLDATGEQLSAVAYAYDAHHRLQSTTDARNGATTYTWYDDDQIHTVTTPDPDDTQSGPGYDPQTTIYTYDNAGRVETVTQPDATMVHTSYYPTGQVKRTWGARTYPVEYTYDPQGRVKTLTTWRDFAGDTGRAVTTWNYDSTRGWLNNKRYNDNTGPAYTYKPSGRLQTRVWARTPTITTTYGYNAAGDLEHIDYSDATPDVTIAYDRTGRPKEMTDGSGTRALSYHFSGQLGSETYTAGEFNGLSMDRSYDVLQRLTALSMPSVYALAYGYDGVSRLDTVTQGANSATYGYLTNSPLVETVAFKQSGSPRLATTKTYDKLNRLESISSVPSTAPSPISASYTYNATNQRMRTTREDDAYWAYQYDDLGQVTAGQKYLSDTTPINGLDYAWTFDDIGNRQSSTANDQSATYAANVLNQYTTRTVPGAVDVFGAALSATTVSFTVDSGSPHATLRQGELFYQQIVVANTSASQRPEIKIAAVQNDVGPNGEDLIAEVTKHALVTQTPEAFVHDADGNLTSDARWNYAWDAENRLISMETKTETVVPQGPLPVSERKRLEFAYDAQSRRYAKKEFSWEGTAWVLAKHTLFLHDGWNMIAELDALNGNAVLRTHVWGLDVSGSMQDAGGVGGLLFTTIAGATHAVAYDGNGNVLGLVDMTDGSRTASYDYNAFGETVISEGLLSEDNPFRFSTKYTDRETGLLYFGYRYYNAVTGRWFSRDPIGEEGGVNLYGFVQNSPVEWIDPLGLALYAFDGTGNDGYRDYHDSKETNVFALWRCSLDPNKAYLPGVGTNDGLLNFLGLVFGYGGQAREKRMLTEAEKFISKGDMVADIVGFSRGGGQARDFANKLKEKYPCVTIRWIGLFDSVPQEGLPNDVNIGYKLGIPKETGSVLHLVAGAERRARTFALTSIRVGPNTPNPNPQYREEVIPDAVHSDVGGYYGKNRGLANLALQRMWRHGRDHGVPFGPLKIRYTNVTPNGPNDSRWLNDMIVEFIIGRNRVRKIYYHP